MGSRFVRVVVSGVLCMAAAPCVMGCSTSVSGPSVVPALQAPAGASANGIYYALPRTVLRAQFVVERTEAHLTHLGREAVASPQAAEVERVLGTPLTALAEGRLSFRLREASLAVRAEADPGQVYFLDLAGRAHEDRNLAVQMSALGLLTGASATVRDRQLETTVRVIASLGGVAATALRVSPDLGAAFTTGIDPGSPKRVLPHAGSEIQAALTRHAELTDARRALLSNLAGVDSGSLLTALRVLREEQEAIVGRFVRAVTTHWSFALEYTPERPCDGEEVVLLRLAPAQGVDVPDMHGVGVPAAFRAPPGATTSAVALRWQKLPAGAQFADVVSLARERMQPGAPSFTYRIPLQARVRLDHVSEAPGKTDLVATLDDMDVPLPQLGTVTSLPAQLRGDVAQYDVAFYEQLGALSRLRIASEGGAQVAGAAEVLGATASRLLEAAAERGRRVEGPSHVERLRGERDRLSLELEIMKLEEEVDRKRTEREGAAGQGP